MQPEPSLFLQMPIDMVVEEKSCTGAWNTPLEWEEHGQEPPDLSVLLSPSAETHRLSCCFCLNAPVALSFPLAYVDKGHPARFFCGD